MIKSSEESDNKEIKRSNFNEAFYEKIIKKHILKAELTEEVILKNQNYVHKEKKMSPHTKYRDEIIKELQDIPDEDMPKLLEIIHYVKIGMKENRKKAKFEKGKDPLFDLRNIAVETGIKDLAEHHDHYLYGVPK